MTHPEIVTPVTDFTVLFDQLESAKSDQPADIQLSLQEDDVVKETMALFSEFQDAKQEASFSSITVG